MIRSLRPPRRLFTTVFALLVVMAVSVIDINRARADHRALLIGIETYSEESKLPDVRFAYNDVRQLENVLRQRGFEVEVLAVSDDFQSHDYLPTRRRIEESISDLLKTTSTDDSVIISFSGHGVRIDGDSYLCPTDGFPRDPGSLVSVSWIKDQMELARALQRDFAVRCLPGKNLASS